MLSGHKKNSQTRGLRPIGNEWETRFYHYFKKKKNLKLNKKSFLRLFQLYIQIHKNKSKCVHKQLGNSHASP